MKLHCPLCAGSLTLVWSPLRTWTASYARARKVLACKACGVGVKVERFPPKRGFHETEAGAVRAAKRIYIANRKAMEQYHVAARRVRAA